MKKNRVSDEIVKNILERIETGESVRKLSQEYDVGQTTIYDWISGKRRVSKGYDPSMGSLSEFNKSSRLEKENKELRDFIRNISKEIKRQKKEN